MSDVEESRKARLCARTGLALIRSIGQKVYRLAKPSYGPLNPLQRGITSAESRSKWNRYDIAGGRTVYAATTAKGAYGELLNALRPNLLTYAQPATDFFDDVSPDEDVLSLIRQDWVSAGNLAPRQIDLSWLREFNLYLLTLPRTGWFVDVEASPSLAAIARSAPPSIVESGISDITTAELRSSDRWLTTTVATTIHKMVLDDRTQPRGMKYGSRYGSDWDCWGIWLGPKSAHSTTKADAGTPVLKPADNPPLDSVLQLYGLSAVL